MNIFTWILSFFSKPKLVNFGLDGDQKPRDTDWVAGVESGIKYKDNIDSGDWSSYLPDPDLQVLDDGKTKWETNACTCFSAANIIKSQGNWMLKNGKLTADEVSKLTDWGYIINGKFSISPRLIALASGNDPGRGNSFVNVWDAIINKNCIVPEKMCPKGNSEAEFYAPVGQNVYDFGKNFFTIFQINYEFVYSGQCNVDVNLLKYHLRQAPLQIASPVCQGWFDNAVVQAQPICVSQHATDLFSIDNVLNDFDSETTTPRKLALNYPITGVLKGVLSKIQPAPDVPQVNHLFLTDMTLGDKGPEVVFLQDRLKQLGFFPLNVESTGNYGNITKTAVAAFQKSRGINPKQPGVYCWVQTRTELNK